MIVLAIKVCFLTVGWNLKTWKIKIWEGNQNSLSGLMWNEVMLLLLISRMLCSGSVRKTWNQSICWKLELSYIKVPVWLHWQPLELETRAGQTRQDKTLKKDGILLGSEIVNVVRKNLFFFFLQGCSLRIWKKRLLVLKFELQNLSKATS